MDLKTSGSQCRDQCPPKYYKIQGADKLTQNSCTFTII